MRPGRLEAELRLGRLDRAGGLEPAALPGPAQHRHQDEDEHHHRQRGDEDAGIRLHVGFSGFSAGRGPLPGPGRRVRTQGLLEDGPGGAGLGGDVELPVTQHPQHAGRLDQAEEEDRQRTGVHIAADAVAALALADDVGHAVEVAGKEAEQPLAALGVADVEVVGEQDALQAAVLVEEAHVALEQPPQRLDRVVGLRPRRGDRAVQALAHPLEHGVEQRILAAEVPVDGGGREADPAGDGRHAQAAHAAVGHERERGVNDLVLADLGLELLAGHGSPLVNARSQYRGAPGSVKGR